MGKINLKAVFWCFIILPSSSGCVVVTVFVHDHAHGAFSNLGDFKEMMCLILWQNHDANIFYAEIVKLVALIGCKNHGVKRFAVLNVNRLTGYV